MGKTIISQTYTEYCQKSWYNRRNKYFKALEYLSLKPGLRILDIGFGRSPMLELIQQKSCSVLGIDNSNSVINSTPRSLSDTNILKADASYLPFREKTFDRILMLDILEELERVDLLKALSEARRILKDDGVILVHYPNSWGNWLEYFFIKYIKRNDLEAEYFYRSFSEVKILNPLKLNMVFKKIGFKTKIWFAGSSLLEESTGYLRKLANTILFFLTAVWVTCIKNEQDR